MEMKNPQQNQKIESQHNKTDHFDSGRCSANSDVINTPTSQNGSQSTLPLLRHSIDSGFMTSSNDDDEEETKCRSDVINEDDLEFDEFAVLFHHSQVMTLSHYVTNNDDTTTSSTESLLGDGDHLRHNIRHTHMTSRKSSLPINIAPGIGRKKKDLLLKKRANSSPMTASAVHYDVTCTSSNQNHPNSSLEVRGSILERMKQLSRTTYYDSTLIFGEKPKKKRMKKQFL